tara:strand:+ start:7084 stop:8013 length:930 start_codon:yes stop_codon:yes gene_type:complete
VLKQRLSLVQRFLNYDIDSIHDFNFDEGKALETKNIYKPDLFGSPSPRMEAVSSQVHFRRTENDYSQGVYFSTATVGRRYVAIPGLCTRIKVAKPGFVHFRCSFYAFETGGAARAKAEYKWIAKSETPAPKHPTDKTKYGLEYTTAAITKLFVNNKAIGSTARYIKAGQVRSIDQTGQNCFGGHILQTMLSRHQYSVVYRQYLDEGVHDIGICIKPNKHYTAFMMGNAYEHSGSSKARVYQQKHIYVLARSMVADFVYNDGDYDITIESSEDEEYNTIEEDIGGDERIYESDETAPIDTVPSTIDDVSY